MVVGGLAAQLESSTVDGISIFTGAPMLRLVRTDSDAASVTLLTVVLKMDRAVVDTACDLVASRSVGIGQVLGHGGLSVDGKPKSVASGIPSTGCRCTAAP